MNDYRVEFTALAMDLIAKYCSVDDAEAKVRMEVGKFIGEDQTIADMIGHTVFLGSYDDETQLLCQPRDDGVLGVDSCKFEVRGRFEIPVPLTKGFPDH